MTKGRLFRGAALVEQGLVEEGLAEFERGDAWRETAQMRPPDEGGHSAAAPRGRHRPRLLIDASTLAAGAHARAGRWAEALRCAATAKAWVAGQWVAGQDDPPTFTAEEHRRVGVVLTTLPGPDRDHAEAEACFQRAIEVARSQGALLFELRAARDFARLRRNQGRVAEARDLLAPVYASFTEGFGFPDLAEACALLDELGAAPVATAENAVQTAAASASAGRCQDHDRAPVTELNITIATKTFASTS